MTGFQTSVSTQPAPAVAGDFASANPRFMFDAGPGGLVAGANGLTVGLFAWVAPYPLDADGTGQAASNSGAGAPSGFVHREQQALITTYLAESGNVIPAGFPCSLLTGGDVWVTNDSATVTALVGMKAYANNGTGKVRFGATGIPTVGGSGTLSSIAATTQALTASIAGSVMTVASGTVVIGGSLSGTDGTTTINTATVVISQLTGTIGGAGTYGLSIDNGTVNSTTITETYGVLTVGGTATGTFAVGDKLNGTSVTAGSTITALGTGTGGAGTYVVSKSQDMSASPVSVYSDTETKFYAMSSGAPGELVKISDHALG